MGLSPLQVLLIFVSFVIVLLGVALIKKIYYYVRYKKRFYIIPRVSVKGISIIAMVISISIAIIILLTVASADLFAVIFRAWPGTRVTLEGILIKIGGLLFGPFIGMFIGGMTDLLSVSLTAGVFHYGYLIAAMGYGLIGGLIRSIFTFSRNNKLYFAILSSIFTAIIAVIISLFLYFGVQEEYFSISFLGLDINVKKITMIAIIASFIGTTILIIWVCLIAQKIQNKKNKNSNWFDVFTPVLVAILLSEAIINVLMMPSFDAELSSLTYVQWIAIRAILFVPMIFLNVIIIYPIFKIVVPLINYDYSKELVESKKIPIFVN